MAKRSVEHAPRESTARKNASRSRPGRHADHALHPEIEAEIGRHLQTIYRAVLEEPVPDRFIRLLADLEQSNGT